MLWSLDWTNVNLAACERNLLETFLAFLVNVPGHLPSNCRRRFARLLLLWPRPRETIIRPRCRLRNRRELDIGANHLDSRLSAAGNKTETAVPIGSVNAYTYEYNILVSQWKYTKQAWFFWIKLSDWSTRFFKI